MANGELEVIEQGDRMRFSVPLLEKIHALPGHQSLIVRVRDIKRDDHDHTKVVVVDAEPEDNA